MSENVFKTNDFFCGAGGMGLGFKKAGFEIAGAWDFDKHAVQTYSHNVGEHVQEMDITKMTAADVPEADVWTFGFPCQDLSNAGKQAGLHNGKRSKMFFEVMRLLDEITEGSGELPKILLAENVRGLRKYLPVLKDEYNKRGYRMVFGFYNSRFWGVPQSRERYFVFGIRNDLKKAFSMPRQFAGNEVELSSILEEEVPEKYYVEESKVSLILKKSSEDPHGGQNESFSAVATAAPVYHIKQATKKGFDIATEGDAVNLAHPTSKTRRGRVGKKTANTILTAPEQVVIQGHRMRYFTSREVARLQGFPDDFEVVVSESQFYKQIGNAVTVNVAEAMAIHAAAYLRKFENN